MRRAGLAGMQPHFPHRYTATHTRLSHGRAEIASPPRPRIVGGSIPELHGDPNEWSAEHLLVAALGLSLFTTFDVFAARDNISVREWRDTVTGTIAKPKADGLAFTTFEIEVEITVDDADVERARIVLERAKHYCIVSRALELEVKVIAHVWSHDQRAHVPS